MQGRGLRFRAAARRSHIPHGGMAYAFLILVAKQTQRQNKVVLGIYTTRY